ncbi:MAG: fasciclin domain-containing protein [Flavobacteriaceae bacterium]|nr:fasciclin domain-containing protein [Flavobacteriaceae bacterium]
MMNNYRPIVSLILLITFLSCSKEETEVVEPAQSTLYDLVANSMNYTYLEAALRMTNLDEVLGGDDVYTLYAPDNNAFIGFLMRSGFNSLEEVPRETLKQILLNHVMIGQMEYRDFKSGYFQTAATSAVNGNAMSIYINQVNMRVTLNGESRIVQGNVRASNGIIHVVDRIIPLPSLVTFVLADPLLYNLAVALTRNDLTVDFTAVLSTQNGTSPAPFTVFAPNNLAFLDLLTELGVDRLIAIDEPTLNSTLNHHVVGEINTLSSDLSDNLLINTLEGEITANVTGGASLTDGNNRVSNIIVVDVQANNGVLHIIDKVILPF